MSNLTSIFQKYVAVIDETRKEQDERNEHIKEEGQEDLRNSDEIREIVNDSFIKECAKLLKFLIELNRVIKEIEKNYMDDLNMTDAEKDEFDMECRLQIQQYFKKFEFLENYEMERHSLLLKKFQSKPHKWSNLLSNKNNNGKQVTHPQDFEKGVHEFRLGVLRCLNLWIKYVSSKFTTIQQERLISENKMNFNSTPVPTLSNNADDLSADAIDISVSQSAPVETVQDEVKHYEETISKLTQVQLQVLETEHSELLNQKNEQLKKVETINKTILDVVNIQNELSNHLTVQSQNINLMLNNQDDIEVNIKKGNKELRKAKRAAGRTAKMTTYGAIAMGIFILLLDYVS
ncbi:Ufe1p [Saccharomyces cerevisiae x Saccharomyces kudriavzevii VIN7]|uniref:Ufe1p n=1 Tax=Saccharomyces cerevisiae x Saccharomyces kudriavzevii (strain VIN7) TaxID=1095631 RepID=H0H126_SACCK|nr:Ufe1p [Saccharomyces cerevisiae x Saccharomyces kudriavzevii VIN7]